MKEETKYRSMNQLTDLIYETRNFVKIRECCDAAISEKKNKMVIGKRGLGRTIALTYFTMQVEGVFYFRVKHQSTFESLLKQLSDALTPQAGVTLIEKINSIIEEIRRRKVSLLILDDFFFSIELMCAASLICEALAGMTAVIFSCESNREWIQNIREDSFSQFFRNHIHGGTVDLAKPCLYEVRQICLDRGITHWTTFHQNCKTFSDLNDKINQFMIYEMKNIPCQ